MKVIGLKQNTPEWRQFRRTHIGASDAVVIMGLSPWCSPLKLYEQKIFDLEVQENIYMARGKELEPIALANFEKDTGLIMFPMCIQHETIPYMSASMDGLNLYKTIGLEIKCPGKSDHAKALKGEIPKKYYPQLQHQMEVCELPRIFYYSFDGESGVSILVERDQYYINEMKDKISIFWYHITNLIPPG